MSNSSKKKNKSETVQLVFGKNTCHICGKSYKTIPGTSLQLLLNFLNGKFENKTPAITIS